MSLPTPETREALRLDALYHVYKAHWALAKCAPRHRDYDHAPAADDKAYEDACAVHAKRVVALGDLHQQLRKEFGQS